MVSEAVRAARTATQPTIGRLPGIFEQTTHGANRARPPNRREEFLASIKRDPRYSGYTAAQREQLWKSYKELADHERVVTTRGHLGVTTPTIDLNTCSIDALERIPKLSLPVRQAIIKKRNSLPAQRFTCWEELLDVPGLGATMLRSLKVFCQDPSIPTATEATSGMANRVLVVSSSTTEDTERHQMTTAIQQLLTLWTRTNENKPGNMYQDSGCNRCVAGKEVHAAWQRYLAKLGLSAVRVEKVE